MTDAKRQELVRMGARARLAEIEVEATALRAILAGRAPASPRKTRRAMSAAERRQVSERMTKYWAARRKATAAKKG